MFEPLQYDFMQNAYAAGTIVGIVVAAVGFFVVLRGLTFAGDALAHVGFAGAAGIILIGLSPTFGMVGLCVLGGIVMGLLGERVRGRDVAIGIVMAFALGLGALFLSLYTRYATEAFNILFGTILGVSRQDLLETAIAGLVTLVALAIVGRPLLFASVDPEVAEARGVPVRLLSALFFVILAIAVAEAVQVVGILLLLTILVGPAATAGYLVHRPGRVITLAVAIALIEIWAGITLAYYVNAPVSFFIAAISFAFYLLARFIGPRLVRYGRATATAVAVGVLLTGCGGSPAPSASAGGPAPIPVVAAENFYGDVVSQVGGSHVQVTSILSDPNVDPHLYESSVQNAKALASARLVVKNGLGYDAFVDKLLAAAPRQGRRVIDAGQAMGVSQDANPHIWYKPETMPKIAQAIADALAQLDPADKAEFESRAEQFNAALAPVRDRVAAIKASDAGAKVLPTEPVFDDMAEALGLDIVDKDGKFQRAVEDGNDPPADAVASFRQQLTSRSIRVLIYNSQASTPITDQMRAIAKQYSVPVVGVTETEPPNTTYQQWMQDELGAVQQALSSSLARRGGRGSG